MPARVIIAHIAWKETLLEEQTGQEDLEKNDGQEGRAAYIGYRGNIYDVSRSKLWPGGVHQRMHEAGQDLTAHFQNAPHDESVFLRVPKVGRLTSAQRRPSNRALDFYLDLHPHPVAVHFPIALTIAAAGFLLLYLATGIVELIDSAYYALLTGIVVSPATISTGIISWWFNHQHKLNFIFKGKSSLAAVLFTVEVIAVVLWSTNRSAFVQRDPVGWAYFALVMVMVGLLLGLGRLGGELVFPPRKNVRTAAR